MPDEPDHFQRWLSRLDPEARAEAGERTIAGTFVRRSVFGAYVQELLREVIARQDGGDNLFLVTDEATAIRRAGRGYRLETANGRIHSIDAAVLALGNAVEPKQSIPGFVENPWSAAAAAPLESGLPVVVLGTGLTMVDVCLALTEQGFEGPIHAISRRGLLPLGHAPSTPWHGPGPRCARQALPAGAVSCRPPRGSPGRGECRRLAGGDRCNPSARADPVVRAKSGR